MRKVFLFSSTVLAAWLITVAGNFIDGVDITWGNGRGVILDGGNLLTLRLDRASGSGFQSKHEYMFGRVDMQIKLVTGDSAGTVTAYYLSSQGSNHDEIDLEFLGNVSGEPYTLHTNVFSQGKGNREQQFYLWFDPRADFHTYSIVWNPKQIIFYVDGSPIRTFNNLEEKGVPYPKAQPMRLYSSLWDAEDWATQNGRVKTDWSKAPFVATYKGFLADGCVWSNGRSSCPETGPKQGWWNQVLDPSAAQRMKLLQDKHMIYNYCKDSNRFPQGFPPECFAP